MNLDEIKSWLRGRFESLLAHDNRWRRRLQICLIIGGVLLAGVGEATSNIVPDALKAYCVAAWYTGLALAFLGGVVLAFIGEAEPQTLIRAQQAVEELESQNRLLEGLEVDFRWMTRVYTVNSVFREIIEQVLINGGGTEEEQRGRMGAMLDVLVSDNGVPPTCQS
jgi:hypothetical protein